MLSFAGQLALRAQLLHSLALGDEGTMTRGNGGANSPNDTAAHAKDRSVLTFHLLLWLGWEH